MAIRRAAALLRAFRAGELPAVHRFLPLLGHWLARGAPRVREPERQPPAAARAPGRPRGRGITVFSVIRNGVQNGYPFVEAYASWLRYADRIVVLDGESTDPTREALAALAELDDRLAWWSAPWPAASGGGGRSIADFTNEALAAAREGASRLVYVQADEIFTPEQRALVRDARTGAIDFAGCVNFWSSFETVLENDFPMRYVRAFAADEHVRAVGDGFTFDVGGQAVTRVDERILHYGWCFPVNILRKHVNHARLYPDQLGYVLRGRLAEVMLAEERYDRALLDALLPAYRAAPFAGEHPECMRHLLRLPQYDPELGLQLLRSGVRW